MKKTLILGTAMAAAMLLLTGCEQDEPMVALYGPVVENEDNRDGDAIGFFADNDAPIDLVYGPAVGSN